MEIFFILLVAFVATVSSVDPFSEPLLGFKSEITDHSNSLSSWNENPFPCSWSGISCTRNPTMITGIDLSNKNLSGSLPGKHIKLLKDLVTLNLSQNSFSGELPVEIFSLVNLTTLDISRNNFSGEFPAAVSSVENLVVLNAFSNSFSGSLPEQVVKLDSLKVLNLAGSYFKGPIPPTYGLFKRLEFLHLAGNFLDGAIPQQLGMLKTVTHMEIGYNFYQGYIPWELGDMSELRYLDIAGANLSGPIPQHFCQLNKLQSLFMFRNQLTGTIPWCFGNITTLLSLDLSDNFITGSIPQSFSNLRNLRLLSVMYNDMTGSVPEGIAELPFLDTLLLWNNYFSGPLPWELGRNSKLKYVDVSTNNFTGQIPPDICAGATLIKLILFSNNFTGKLSPALTNCSSLTRLRLEDNSFSGEISLNFSLLRDMTYMDLSRNMFTKGIPSKISQASKLHYFNISKNPLGGTIPSKLWSLKQLENFSASSCGISGDLPSFISCQFVSIVELNSNNLSGLVPESVANCKALEKISLANNHLRGNIPMEFANITTLRVLDLSSNEFNGEIPFEFGNSSSLVLLNLSFNDVSGMIPSKNVFRLMGASAFTGNSKLCGAPLQPCPRNPDVVDFRSERKSSSSEKPTWVLLSCVGMALFIVISLIGIFYLQKERNGRWKMIRFIGLPQITPHDITKSFIYSDSICKAVLPTGITVSVKKVEWDVKRTRMEEFVNQMGNVRHKNLVRLLGVCCNKQVAFLLYDYLPNGNLDEKMREKGEPPLSSWGAKYKVMIGIARGLCYLHLDCYPAIPHGDLKANNVVFDENMEPRLAGFGLKTLIQMNDDVSGTDEIDSIIKEEISGDINNFGEIILEILTNGRWTNKEKSMETKPREIILKELYEENEVGSSGELQEEIKLVLEVALLCIRCSPSMNDVMKLLSELKP